MDGQSIDRWVVPDYRYTGIGGNSLSTFGNTITTDSNGNASGMLAIPSGLPPQSGSSWTGDVNTLSYDSEKGSPLSFITGIKQLSLVRIQLVLLQVMSIHLLRLSIMLLEYSQVNHLILFQLRQQY